MEAKISPEIREVFQRPIKTLIEANGYVSRAELDLNVNGVWGKWHSLKGGLLHSADKIDPGLLKGISYQILYSEKGNPSWLKMVPPEAPNVARMENKLRTSVVIAGAALSIAGLPELVPSLVDAKIQALNKLTGQTNPVYGFVSPHLGGTLENCFKALLGTKRPNELPDDLLELAKDVYGLAFDQAARLATETGYWAGDPNPGNIILHFKESSYSVVLIDFSNKVQHLDQLSGNMSSKMGYLGELFKKQCSALGVPFSPDIKRFLR